MQKILIVAITTLGLVVGMGGALGTAEAAKKPSTFKVKAEVSASRIISGQTVFVTGSVKPLSIGRKVILQKRYKKRKGDWKKVDVSRVRADGVFELSDRPRTSRKRWYRVVKKAGDGHRKGVSKKMKITIEPWDGRVEVKLLWDSSADLDLMTELEGDDKTISWRNPGPTKSGGEFDGASTVDCGGPGGFERISWPNEDAPVGVYKVSVHVPPLSACSADDEPGWQVEVRVNNRLVKVEHGTGEAYVFYWFGVGGLTW